MSEYTAVATDEKDSSLLVEGQKQEDPEEEYEDEEGSDEEEDYLYEEGDVPIPWLKDLQKVQNDAIDEMNIHEVPWDGVAKECVLNGVTMLFMLGFFVWSGVNPILNPVLFSGMFIVVVVASERSITLGMNSILLYTVLMLGVSAVEAYFLHPTGPLDLLGKTPFILGTGLLVSSLVNILVGACIGDLHTSGLYCALTKKSKIKLDGKFELAKLLKSLRVLSPEEEYQRAGWLGSRLKPKKPLAIGVIKADKNKNSPNDEIPDANLELQGQTFRDSQYWLVGFMGLNGFGNITDANQSLMGWLRELAAKNKISKKLRVFLEPDIKPKKKQNSTVNFIKDMFVENGLTEEPFQDVVIIVQRIDPVQGFWDHWATRALFVSLLVALLSLPARSFVEKVISLHQDLCTAPTGSIKMPDGEVLCKDKTECAQMCGDPMKYINAVTTSVHTSKAEALFIFTLLPVYIFMMSVLMVREQHMAFEMRYLRGMSRTRAAIREVLAFKLRFESTRSISETFKRFLSRFAAWSPFSTGDPSLSALQSFCAELDHISGSGAGNVQNGAFEAVSKTMLGLTDRQEIDDSGVFWNGLYAADFNKECGMMNPEEKWQDVVKKYQLGTTDRNYSVSWTVNCASKASWELWKNWLQGEDGQRMLDCMLQSQSAQDGQPADKSTRCYLGEDLRIGNQLIPKGFSLTHILCMDPEDDSPFVVELRKGASASEVEDEPDSPLMRSMAFWFQINEMEELFKENGYEVTDYGFGIALRFVVSEQFWSKLGSDPVLSQLKGKTMTEFITNVIKEKDCPTFTDVDDASEMTMSKMTLVLGEVDPAQSMKAVAKVLLKRLMVVILTFLFMLIIPCFRVYVKGGKLFPEPFANYLIGNAVCCAIVLWNFFSMFQLTSERLSLVSSSLAEFEQKTLDPSGKAAKAKKGVSKDKAQKSLVPVSETSPFDLTVNDSGHKYVPNGEGEDAEFFQNQWKEKQDNVKNWHYCIGYVRVFISSSRLTAQAILVAAGFILAFLLLMSFLDVMGGANGAEAAQFAEGVAKHAKHAAGQMVHELKGHAKDALDQTVRDIQGSADEMVSNIKTNAKEAVHQTISDIQGTRRLSLNLGMVAGPINVVSGSIAYTNATEALQELAQPVRHALSGIARRLAGQHEDSDDIAAKALQDVEKIQKKMLKAFDLAKTVTETQFVTVALVILVLLYSVPLIYYVALINGSLDKHDNLLLVQKETHRMNMSNRQASLTATAAEPAADGAADPNAADPSGKASDKDVGCKRYEKMLDMAIEAAQTSKSRFPLKLFGFIINMALLTTWITLALSPVAKQVQGMAPGLAMAGCQWVENLDIIKQAENMTNQGVDKANEGINMANQGIDAVNNGMQQGLDKVNQITAALDDSASDEQMEKFKKISTLQHFNFKKLLDSYVCKPLTKMVAEQAAKAMSHLQQTRRLRSIEPLAPAVESWWHAHPGDPHVKLTLVLSILNDLEKTATEVSSAMDGGLDQFSHNEVWNARLKPSLLPDGDHEDFQAWGKLHGVAPSIMSALNAEGIHTMDELAHLSAKEVDFLSQENTIGDRARFRRFVNVAQKVSSKKFDEL